MADKENGGGTADTSHLSATADTSLMGDPTQPEQKNWKMFDFRKGEGPAVSGHATTADARPKIQEMGFDGRVLAPPPAPEKEPEPEAEPEEESLADLMMADAAVDKAARDKTKAAEEKRMKKTFGDGMKKGLKKGFFDSKPKKKGAAPKKKPPPKPKPTPKPAEPPAVVDFKPTGNEQKMTDSIKDEVKNRMKQSESPLAEALRDGEWVTPDLVKELARRPVLAEGMSNPEYQAALKELQADPQAALKKFDKNKGLKRFLTEFCEVMGSHFVGMHGGEKVPVSTPPLPTEAEKKQMGPLAAEVVEAAARGEGPEPPKSEAEQKEVERVLQDTELRDLLMDKKTQELMQRCANPMECGVALRDPKNRAIIAKLEKAGLVSFQR